MSIMQKTDQQKKINIQTTKLNGNRIERAQVILTGGD